MQDIRSFNKTWMRTHIDGAFPTALVSGLPPVSDVTVECLELVEEMGTCFMRSLLSANQFSMLVQCRTDDSASPIRAHSAVQITSVKLIKEWLFLARLKAKDAIAGQYSAMRHMHMSWEDTSFYANLTNESILSIAARASAMPTPVLQWAWPKKIFEPTTLVPPSLNRAWAFALTA